MSNFSYDDFAVLVRSVQQDMLSSGSLRIVPLSAAPRMADAIRGTNLAGLDSLLNLPKQKNGNVVESNVTVQHDSAGYCRLVGHIEAVKPQGGQAGQEELVTTAKAFVLYRNRTVTGASDTTTKEVIAVASLKEGFAIGDVCYPSFTITTVNNYQSVAFNPNAFATVEDLKNINGLDGLHIAFDTASGDLKLLDKDGNVLDQANLPIKTDVIIADGEEGYKYVKTDVKQDIHAAKAWMPEGKTAWETVGEVPYTMQHAALVVEQISTPASRVFKDTKSDYSSPVSTEPVQFDHVAINDSIYMVVDKTETNCNLVKVKGEAEAELDISAGISGGQVTHGNQSYVITNEAVEVDVVKAGETTHVLVGTKSPSTFRVMPTNGTHSVLYTGTIETSGGSSADRVLGIALADQEGTNLYTFDEGDQPHAVIKNISGSDVRWFDVKPLTEVTNHTLKYGLEAFVWTVKGIEVKLDDPFFQQLNDSLLDLGFHEGDDIALGTNLAKLSTDLNGVDADDYIHGETNKATREKEVDAQRAYAKEELVAWNAQHPGLDHDGLNGTRISSDGVDIRNGKIEIGNGVANNNDKDSVKRYVIETDIDDRVGARADKGLQISVVASQNSSGDGATHIDVQKDILTINAEDYISGAPTCLALLKCSKSGDQATVSAGLEGGRITANFTASGAEADGVFTLTITDNRTNNDFGYAPRIVEIIPVYKSGADAQEAVPAQRSISAIATAETNDGGKTLSIQCSQVIDWAQSIDLGGTEGQDPTGNGMELYLIVKVY